MFCCNTFKNLISNAGDRGLAILICKTDDGLRFEMQSRAVAFSDEASFSLPPSSTLPTYITLSETLRIRYCPSCGKKLADLIGEDARQFEQLAVQHKPFLNKW